MRAHDQAELAAVRELRTRLEQLWTMDKDAAVQLVNALLREASALPQLVRHDGWDYHVHATPPDAPLADRMAVEAAMAFTDVIRGGQLDRLRRCAAAHCDNVHIDLSKNSSRRFCSVSCANRTNVAAYRTRQAAQPRPPDSCRLTARHAATDGELTGACPTRHGDPRAATAIAVTITVTTSNRPGRGPGRGRPANWPTAQTSGAVASTIRPETTSVLSITAPTAAKAIEVRAQASLVRSLARPGSTSSGSSGGTIGTPTGRPTPAGPPRTRPRRR